MLVLIFKSFDSGLNYQSLNGSDILVFGSDWIPRENGNQIGVVGREWKKDKLRYCQVEILKVQKRLEKEKMNLYNPSKNSVS